MANDEHLEILKRGSVAWNDWRRANHLVTPDIGRCDLKNAIVSEVGYRAYNFSKYDFSKCNLREVELGSLELTGLDFGGANLSGANLSDANLRGARLCGAALIRANLNSAILTGADLTGASLRGADLSWADLSRAQVQGTNLTEANLQYTRLFASNLDGANLRDALLDLTTLSSTNLTNIDLTPFVNTQITHGNPSTVDHRSIARSLHCSSLLPFLVATGMPEIVASYLLDSIRSLDPNGLFNLMHSTFISYGGPDEAFAIKLQEALQSNGVTTFLFKKDAVPGHAISDVMRDQVKEKDRIVVICSEASLDRPGVLNEMELTLRREAKEGGHTLLIPVAIDDYTHTGWAPENENLRDAILERVIADFESADADQSKFDEGMNRLLKALKIKTSPVSQ